jgi:hypothetical protein
MVHSGYFSSPATAAVTTAPEGTLSPLASGLLSPVAMSDEEAYVLCGQPRVRVTVRRSRVENAVTIFFRTRPFGEAMVRLQVMDDGSVMRQSRGVLPGLEARALCEWLELELAHPELRAA